MLACIAGDFVCRALKWAVKPRGEWGGNPNAASYAICRRVTILPGDKLSRSTPISSVTAT